MFENVEQLEREIKEFEANVLASKALIQNIKDVTNTIKEQNERFGIESDRLILRINEVPADIDEYNKEHINTLIEENKKIADGLSSIASEVKTYENLIEDKYDALLSEANELLKSTIIEANSSFKQESDKYLAMLQKVSDQLAESEKALEDKYKNLISKTENTNAKILKDLAEINSTINSKNTIIIILIVVCIVLGVVGIIL